VLTAQLDLKNNSKTHLIVSDHSDVMSYVKDRRHTHS